jgi:hypothetical protein
VTFLSRLLPLVALALATWLVIIGFVLGRSGPVFCGLLIIAGVLLLFWVLYGEPRMLDALSEKE